MTFALLAAGLVAGMLAARFRWAGTAAPQRINAFIINIALPAMILLKVPGLELNAHAAVPVLAAWGVISVSAFCVWSLGRFYRWDRSITGALLLVVPLTNSAYLGLPLLNVFFDDVVVAFGAFYDQFGNFVALSVYAPIVAAVYANPDDENVEHRAPGFTGVLVKLFSFAPFPVLLICVVFLSEGMIPDWTKPVLGALAALMGPLAAFIVGYSLKFTVPRSLRVPLFYGLGLRLLVGPVIAWGIVVLLGNSAPALTASVLQAAMPTMITAGLVGIAAGFSERLIVAMISISTLLSVASLTALFAVFS